MRFGRPFGTHQSRYPLITDEIWQAIWHAPILLSLDYSIRFGCPFGCSFGTPHKSNITQEKYDLADHLVVFGYGFVAILHAFGWSFGRHLADCLAVDLSRFCTRLADIWLSVWLWICHDLHAFGWPGAFGMLAHTFHQQLLIMITHPKALSRYFN